MPKRKYSTAYAEIGDVGRITDEMVAECVKEHTHWWERLDYHLVSDLSQAAFLVLSGSVEKPKEKYWSKLYK